MLRKRKRMSISSSIKYKNIRIEIGVAQITNSFGNTNYYRPEYYSRAWQYYYGK